MRKAPTPWIATAVFSSISSSYSRAWRSVSTSYSSCLTVSEVMMVWLTGMATPLILMLIGAPTERKMSDAFLSAMTWNSSFIADMSFSDQDCTSLIPAQQFIQAGLGAGLGVYLLHIHRTIQPAAAVRRGKTAGNHHRPGRHAPVEDLPACAAEDARALAQVHPHRYDAVFLDDYTFHDLGAGADEAVVLDDHRIGLQRLQDAADAHAAGQVHVLADLSARPDGRPRIDHGSLVDVGADIHVRGHEHHVAGDVGAAPRHGGRNHPEAAF